MTEEPFFFQGESYKLFGVLHKTDEVASEGFVFCHPLAEEKLWTHRVFVTFARELARRGYPVLRFDFMGHGDSEGKFDISSIETRMSDIESAIDIIRKKLPHIKGINLLGMRLGATLAALTAEKVEGISKLILWDPVTDGAKYMQEVLRTNLSTQLAVFGKITEKRLDLVQKMKEGGTVNIDGYELSCQLFEQASAINLLDNEKTFKGDCLIVQMSKRTKKIRSDLEALGSIYTDSSLIQVEEEPFWKEIKEFYTYADNLYDATLTWLEERNG
ncbi:MAG: alpha/beta fold hydrolase [Gammaproteobacteria bacterium]|nr:alpha/beta fold hydrolase [Gammaproteobacteria bacterium]